jgi:rubrerythrin
MMAGKGFKRIYNLSGGMKAWQNETAIGPPELGLDLFTGAETSEQTIIIGYGLEQGLREFYLEMAAQVSSLGSKSLFTRLADIEILHQQQLVALYKQVSGTELSRTDFETKLVQPAMEGGLTTTEYLLRFNPDLEQEQDILGLAMSIEGQALDLYERGADQTTDTAIRDILKQIAREERSHIAQLAKHIDEMA